MTTTLLRNSFSRNLLTRKKTHNYRLTTRMRPVPGMLKMKMMSLLLGNNTWKDVNAMLAGKFFILFPSDTFATYFTLIVSLEKLHVIKCGYSTECNPHVPEELYDHLGISQHSVESPFMSCPEYVQAVFDAVQAVSAIDLCLLSI